jgi:hypothetical protein
MEHCRVWHPRQVGDAAITALASIGISRAHRPVDDGSSMPAPKRWNSPMGGELIPHGERAQRSIGLRYAENSGRADDASPA